MSLTFRSIMLVASLFAILVPSLCHAQATGLASRVPNDANAIVIVNADKIMASPIAKKENWRAKREQAAAAGLTIMPPTASTFVLASKMDLHFMHPIWEVAIAKVSYDPSVASIAGKWNGTIDRIAGYDAALLPDDTYIVRLGPAHVAARRPGSRQSVTRWLKSTDTSRGHQLSAYMKKALAYSDKLGTPIVMALDLEGIASAESMQKRLRDFECLKGKDVDVAKVAKSLESIEGITLGINVKDDFGGAMVIDFAGDTSVLKGIAKPLLLEILENQSASINEFYEWKAVVEPNRVRVGGKLYPSGLQRIMSVLGTPAALHELAPKPGEKIDPKKAMQLASQQCFKSVTGLLDDLRRKPRQASGTVTPGSVGIWWSRYADKIDKLPMLNVDEQLLDYRYFVSSSLRDGSTALRNVGAKSRVREMNAPPQYQYATRWGSTGWYGATVGYEATVAVESGRLEMQDRARIRTEERAQGAASARDIMKEIDEETAKIKAVMTKKYQAEF